MSADASCNGPRGVDTVRVGPEEQSCDLQIADILNRQYTREKNCGDLEGLQLIFEEKDRLRSGSHGANY
jgi:hypothetical protein